MNGRNTPRYRPAASSIRPFPSNALRPSLSRVRAREVVQAARGTADEVSTPCRHLGAVGEDDDRVDSLGPLTVSDRDRADVLPLGTRLHPPHERDARRLSAT